MPPPPLPLPQKLGIKPGFTVSVINAPEGYIEALGALITQARVIRDIEHDADIIHVFVKEKSDLDASFPHLKKILGKKHALWISWPRIISGITTDLKENIVRETGIANGLTDVRMCTINEDWSGIKFVYSLKDR